MSQAFVTLVLILSMLGQTKITKYDAPSAIDRVRYATVLIGAFDGRQVIRLGSGFLISTSGFVVTNKHVVDAAPPNAQVTVSFRVPNQSVGPSVTINEGFVGNSSTIVDLDADHDLALIKTTVPTNLDSAFRVSEESVKAAPVTVVDFLEVMPREGERILVSGYPLHLMTLESQEGMVASQTFRRTVGPSPYQGDSNADLLLVNIPINHGNSGGPVYLPTTGQVVGVAEGFLTAEVEENPALHTNSGTGFVIPAKYVLKLMKKNGVNK